jgi:flagellar hook-basal body complex protein FliE
MTAPLAAVGLISPDAWPMPSPPVRSQPAAGGFQELLTASLEQMQGLSARSQSAVQQSLVADDLSMVETFTAMREADLALRLTLQIRNKLVDAYNELQNLRF